MPIAKSVDLITNHVGVIVALNAEMDLHKTYRMAVASPLPARLRLFAGLVVTCIAEIRL